MKKTILVVMVCFIALTTINAQTWSELTQEQKAMKAKEFRADNQKYLKSTLGMTQDQIDDIDNVNLCYLGTLDRIDRYGKDEANKEKAAEAVTQARWVQLDAIMGPDKHKQYSEYVKGKIKKSMK
jgi:hypothetical protein